MPKQPPPKPSHPQTMPTPQLPSLPQHNAAVWGGTTPDEQPVDAWSSLARTLADGGPLLPPEQWTHNTMPS